MTYQSVATSEHECCKKDLCAIFPPPAVAEYLGGGTCAKANRCKPDCFEDERENHKLEFKVSPESIRFVMYLIFWGMTAVAMAFTKFYTAGQLLAGPKNDAQANCPPFNVASFPGAETVDRTNGFDVYTESHLNQVLGYSHVSFLVLQLTLVEIDWDLFGVGSHLHHFLFLFIFYDRFASISTTLHRERLPLLSGRSLNTCSSHTLLPTTF